MGFLVELNLLVMQCVSVLCMLTLDYPMLSKLSLRISVLITYKLHNLEDNQNKTKKKPCQQPQTADVLLCMGLLLNLTKVMTTKTSYSFLTNNYSVEIELSFMKISIFKGNPNDLYTSIKKKQVL